MISPLSTTVIICTRNRRDDLVNVLNSLAVQTNQPSEIVIVDGSTKPLTDDPLFLASWDASKFFQSKLVYKHTRPGLTYQRNQGTSIARGDIVYFFDDDVVLESDYLERMNAEFEKSPRYIGGMGTVNLKSPFKIHVTFFRSLFFLQRNYSTGRFTLSGIPTHAYGNKKMREVEVLGGCCMAFRSSVFKKHSFDENLKLYGYMEDCDFSYRVSCDGALFFNPAARLNHHESTFERDAVCENKAMFIANYTYLFFKNFYSGNQLRFCAYAWSIFGLFLEAAFVIRNKEWLKGYVKGLRHAIRSKAKPYPE